MGPLLSLEFYSAGAVSASEFLRAFVISELSRGNNYVIVALPPSCRALAMLKAAT